MGQGFFLNFKLHPGYFLEKDRAYIYICNIFHFMCNSVSSECFIFTVQRILSIQLWLNVLGHSLPTKLYIDPNDVIYSAMYTVIPWSLFFQNTHNRHTVWNSDTVETLYSTIYYSKYFIELNFDKSTQYVALWTHKRHPIPRPFGRAMECLLWVLEQKSIVL